MPEIIIDQNGRRGHVTRSAYHPDGVFARPAGSQPVEGQLTMDTFWHQRPDGTFEGRWVDSAIGCPLLTATLKS